MSGNNLGFGIQKNGGGSGSIGGNGTLNYVPKFTPDGTHIGDSQIFDDGNFVGIGTNTPTQLLDVYKNINGLAKILSRNPNAGNTAGAYHSAINDLGEEVYFGVNSSNFILDPSKGVIYADPVNGFAIDSLNFFLRDTGGNVQMFKENSTGNFSFGSNAFPLDSRIYTKGANGLNTSYSAVFADNLNRTILGVGNGRSVAINGNADDDVVFDVNNPNADLVPLRVRKSDSSAIFAVFEAGYSNFNGKVYVGGYFVSPSASLHIEGTPGTTNFLITQGGDYNAIFTGSRTYGFAGISSPSETIHIGTSTSANGGIRMDSSTASIKFTNAGAGLIQSDDGAGGGFLQLFGANSVGDVFPKTGNDLRIATSADAGIGYGIYLKAIGSGPWRTVLKTRNSATEPDLELLPDSVGDLYVYGTKGVGGSFTTNDGKTVTVTKGIITSIV